MTVNAHKNGLPKRYFDIRIPFAAQNPHGPFAILGFQWILRLGMGARGSLNGFTVFLMFFVHVCSILLVPSI